MEQLLDYAWVIVALPFAARDPDLGVRQADAPQGLRDRPRGHRRGLGHGPRDRLVHLRQRPDRGRAVLDVVGPDGQRVRDPARPVRRRPHRDDAGAGHDRVDGRAAVLARVHARRGAVHLLLRDAQPVHVLDAVPGHREQHPAGRGRLGAGRPVLVPADRLLLAREAQPGRGQQGVPDHQVRRHRPGRRRDRAVRRRRPDRRPPRRSTSTPRSGGHQRQPVHGHHRARAA